MSDKATPVDTILYTTEAKDSREKVDQELKVEDPQPEQAIACLNGGRETTKKAGNHESPTG